MTKAIYSNPFFHKYYYTADQINMLLRLIEVHVEVVTSVHNCYKKTFTLINWEWDADIKEYICYQNLVQRSFKFISSVANQCNILDLKNWPTFSKYLSY